MYVCMYVYNCALLDNQDRRRFRSAAVADAPVRRRGCQQVQSVHEERLSYIQSMASIIVHPYL